METFRLHYNVSLDAAPEAVCAFHADTRNLPRITPPWVGIKILSMEVPLRENSLISLRISRFGIPTNWKMKIAAIRCPLTVVDEMVEGPFSFFRHERLFRAAEGGKTLMEETLTFALPFGFAERIVYRWVKKEMDAMFAYRHTATQRCFQERNDAIFSPSKPKEPQ